MFAILGATGKVGRATIGKLRAQGRAVRAVVRNAAKGRDLLDLGCELVVADLRDVASLQAALRDSEAVQLIIPMGVQARDAGAETHALVAAICSAVAAARPAHVLAISDYGAELDAPTGVTRLFHDFEQQLSALDMRLTFLRSAEHMQNWARHIKYAAETGLLPSMHQPNGKLFPTVSAHDVGEASAEFLLRAADENAGPCIVHVEGPRRYTPTDVAAAMSSVLGRPVVAQDPGRSKWLTSLVRGGLSESYAKLVVELYDAHNAGLIDVENGVGELRHGRTPLEEVLRTLAASAGKSAG